jgi:hypothetical protein
LTLARNCDSLLIVKQEAQPKIERILERLPELSDILRGSLLHRTIRPKQGCRKCAAGGGHPVWILATGYPSKRIHQLTLQADQVPQVRRRLANFRKLRVALEQICEYNRLALRHAKEPLHD